MATTYGNPHVRVHTKVALGIARGGGFGAGDGCWGDGVLGCPGHRRRL